MDRLGLVSISFRQENPETIIKAAKAAADGTSAPETDSSDANATESNEANDAPTDSNNTEE